MNDYYFQCADENYSNLIDILVKLGVLIKFISEKGENELIGSDNGSFSVIRSKDGKGNVAILRTDKDIFSLVENKKSKDQNIDTFSKELSKYFLLDGQGKAKIPEEPEIVFL